MPPEQENQLIRDLLRVATTPEGRRVLFWLLSLCQPFAVTFRRNSEGSFLEGRRSVGIDLIDALKRAAPVYLIEILGMGLLAQVEEQPEFSAATGAEGPENKEKEHA